MGLKNLSTETMLSLSAAWTDPQRERPIIQSVQLLAALLPSLDAAHAALLAVRKSSDSLDESLKRLTDEAEKMDTRHDRKVRGSYWLLSALAELAENPADAARVLDLRDRLIPRGPATTGMTYVDEAGNVEALKEMLDEPTHAELRKIQTVGGRTLDDEVKDWVQAGEALGKIENQRSALERQRDGAPTVHGTAAQARTQWIRATRAFLTNAELVSEIDEGTLDRIIGPLYAAESLADRHAAQKPGPHAHAGGGDPKK
ncbi:MAG TPA: hypothetical protein VH877_26955 [Polyangia bacterium]|jgi:hypothetical protein|nr:hypothetical protein [Polyangia bacterium]